MAIRCSMLLLICLYLTFCIINNSFIHSWVSSIFVNFGIVAMFVVLIVSQSHEPMIYKNVELLYLIPFTIVCLLLIGHHALTNQLKVFFFHFLYFYFFFCVNLCFFVFLCVFHRRCADCLKYANSQFVNATQPHTVITHNAQFTRQITPQNKNKKRKKKQINKNKIIK